MHKHPLVSFFALPGIPTTEAKLKRSQEVLRVMLGEGRVEEARRGPKKSSISNGMDKSPADAYKGPLDSEWRHYMGQGVITSTQTTQRKW